MAGYVPNGWRATLLEVTGGRTAVSAATLYLGLATGVPDDPMTSTLDTILEVATAGYARKEIPTFDAASTVAPVQIVVSTAFAFDPLEADMTIPANYAFLTDAAAGTAGVVRYIWELSESVFGRSGEPLNIPASALIIE